jgi:hypothetical protein
MASLAPSIDETVKRILEQMPVTNTSDPHCNCEQHDMQSHITECIYCQRVVNMLLPILLLKRIYMPQMENAIFKLIEQCPEQHQEYNTTQIIMPFIVREYFKAGHFPCCCQSSYKQWLYRFEGFELNYAPPNAPNEFIDSFYKHFNEAIHMLHCKNMRKCYVFDWVNKQLYMLRNIYTFICVTPRPDSIDVTVKRIFENMLATGTSNPHCCCGEYDMQSHITECIYCQRVVYMLLPILLLDRIYTSHIENDIFDLIKQCTKSYLEYNTTHFIMPYIVREYFKAGHFPCCPHSSYTQWLHRFDGFEVNYAPSRESDDFFRSFYRHFNNAIYMMRSKNIGAYDVFDWLLRQLSTLRDTYAFVCIKSSVGEIPEADDVDDGDDDKEYSHNDNMITSPAMCEALSIHPILYKLLMVRAICNPPDHKLPPIDELVAECERDPDAINEQYEHNIQSIYSAWEQRVEMGYDTMGICAVQDGNIVDKINAVRDILKHL